MKEITSITTIEITQVELLDDETVDEIEMRIHEHERRCENTVKNEADVDDVHAHAQLFIREVPDADSD